MTEFGSKVDAQWVFLGRGRLNWDSDERVSDRYGTVRLWAEDGSPVPLAVGPGIEGTTGRLVAVVVEARRSGHVGDLHRGLRPTTPATGEVIVLGRGEFFSEHFDPAIPHEKAGHERDADAARGALVDFFAAMGVAVDESPASPAPPHDAVGLRPAVPRPSDWLDPHRLYRAHDQTVALYFAPGD